MSYSPDVVQKARKILADEKEDRESRYRQNLAEAYSRVPRLQILDRQLRATMARAAQAAFLKGEEGTALLEQARTENKLLSAERDELIRTSFPDGFLDREPVCRQCGGTGYVGASMCSCLEALCRKEQRKRLGRLGESEENFNDFRLDVYPDRIDGRLGVNIRRVMERTLEVCRTYADEFSAASPNLLFSGDTGLGKTLLSSCIARRVTDRGFFVIYESSPNLFLNLEHAKFASDPDALRSANAYSACDFLIIDDLGTELPGQFVNAALYNLLNDRIRDGRPMLVSTNLTSEELAQRYTSQIASRLRGNFRRVAFLGEDVRVRKAQGL